MFKNIDFKKQVLPHLIIVAGFFIAVAIYFSPMVFQGKSMRQHDIIQYQGMAKEIMDYRQKFNEEPFWTNAMFSGMPNTMVNMDQYGNLVKPLHIIFMNFIKYPASLIILSLVCFYILMMAFNINSILAILGSVGFAFASFNFISLEAGHNAKVACMSYMPLVLAGMVFAYRKNVLLGCCIFALGLALQIVNNHVQITYYLAFICMVYFIIELINALQQKLIPRLLKTTAFLGIAALLALGTHAGYFLSINEYSKFSIRGKTELKPLAENKEAVREDGLDRDYVFNYSNSINEPITFLIPDYMGGASAPSPKKFKNTVKVMQSNGYDPQQILSGLPSYFGEQPYVAGPIYMGAIICFLFVLGLFVVKDNLKWGLLAATLIAIFLSYGKNFPALNYLLFDYFPLYNKFRSVTMAVVIPQFCMSLLAVLTVQQIINTPNKKDLIKPFLIATGIVAGFTLLVYVMAGSGNYITEREGTAQLPDWLRDAITSDRKAIRSGDAIRSFIFIALAAGLLYAFLINKLKENMVSIGLVLLTAIDLWGVDKRYLNDVNYEKKVIENYYLPTEADQVLLKDTDPDFRVFNLDNPFNDARTSYFHKSVGGYSPAKLRRYQDLIERVISSEQQTVMDGLKKNEMPFGKIPVLNMLNTKYLILGDDARSVLLNDSALGNAWFVNELKMVNSADEEIASLNNFNPKTTAVLDATAFKAAKTSYATDSTASIKLTAYKPYDLNYESNSTTDGFAVFSEVYYPKGWKALIDGKEAEIKRVNYVLRALEIPAGKHIINFKMENEMYKTGNMIGLICSILLYTGLIAGVYFTVRKDEITS